MDPEWLVRQLTFDELVERFGARADRDWRWQLLFDALEDGDEAWEFRTPREFWQRQCGRAGIALVRGGLPVAQVLTRVN